MSGRNTLWLYFGIMGVSSIAVDRGLHAVVSLADSGVPPALSADLNLDGAVDLRDFAHLQNQFTGPIPLWLQDLIDGFMAGTVYYSPGYVWQYRYLDELVYFVPDRCCNVMSVLYDVYGLVICHPDGGMGGHGDGQCPEFFDVRTDEVLIWEDPRG